MSAHTTDPARTVAPAFRAAPFLRVLARWRTAREDRARIRALLARGDDHLIDDMGTTRDRLRERFRLWHRG